MNENDKSNTSVRVAAAHLSVDMVPLSDVLSWKIFWLQSCSAVIISPSIEVSALTDFSGHLI